MTTFFKSLAAPLLLPLSVLGRAADDEVLVDVFHSLGIEPADDTVTTDENNLEFRFENGVLVEVWVNPGSGFTLPSGLAWDMTPEELHARLGRGEPLGIDKSKPSAFQWVIAVDQTSRAKLYLQMNVDGGFALRGSTCE